MPSTINKKEEAKNNIGDDDGTSSTASIQSEEDHQLHHDNPNAPSEAAKAGCVTLVATPDNSEHPHDDDKEQTIESNNSAAAATSTAQHEKQQQNSSGEKSKETNNIDSTSTASCNSNDGLNLIHRFVDPKVGQQVLQRVQSCGEIPFDLEAMLYTPQKGCGQTWSAIQVRQSKDPVTGQSVILFSAQDKTDAVKFRAERKAREQQAEFLAIMAHEIRTPLHQVTGFVDLLHQTQLSKEQKGFVRLLKTSAQGLMTVINDVLDYSKLEAGKMKLESIPYEPLSVAKGSIEAVRACCEERNLSLTLEWDKNIPFKLKADPNRLRQVGT